MQKLNLFTNHYQCGDIERQKEIDFCFQENKRIGIFSNIINFEGRPVYDDFFKATLEYPNDINILTNSDIYFNDTIKLANEIKENQCFALTRTEIQNGELVPFEVRHTYNKEAKARHSQDVWIFKGAVRNVSAPFHLGRPGCDNHIAYLIYAAGYIVTNPSNRIQCIHKHESDDRKYTIPEPVRGRYMFIPVDGETEQTRKRI